jgi:hypothetical protein
LFWRAAKTFGFANKGNSNWLYFSLPRSQNFWNLTTRLHFVLPRSENFGICQQKQLKLPVRAANPCWNLPAQKHFKLTKFANPEATQIDCIGRKRKCLTPPL